MAEHQRKRVFFVVHTENDDYDVFKVNLKDLFSHDDDSVSLPAPAPAPVTKMDMVPLPAPFPPSCHFQTQSHPREHIAFAVSGNIIVALRYDRTFTYDCTKALAAGSGPSTAAKKCNAILLLVRNDDIYALSLFLHFPGPKALPHFEVLSLGGPTLAWRALPEPPLELQRFNPDVRKPCCKVTTCFTMGGRMWVSALGEGTYSLDTVGARRVWRKEGDWEVPVVGHPAVYVPELGRLLGFSPWIQRLCACDMDARPPVVTELWEETWPWELAKMGYAIRQEGSLVYLGNGNLCITRLVDAQAGAGTSALHVQAVHLQLEKQQQQQRVKMTKRRIRCYTTMAKNVRTAYALQPNTI